MVYYFNLYYIYGEIYINTYKLKYYRKHSSIYKKNKTQIKESHKRTYKHLNHSS